MILVDTSVWIDHLRVSDPRLVTLLLEEQVLRPSLRHRGARFWIDEAPWRNPRTVATPATDRCRTQPGGADVRRRRALMGKGLGWIDVHLLASTVASGHALWTRDKRLTPLSGLVSSLKRAAAIAKKSICQNRQIPTGDVTDVHHHTV